MTVSRKTSPVIIDLNQFKLHLRFRFGTEVTLQFDSPSRRFYLSVMALVLHEMKRLGKITSIPLDVHADDLVLLNGTVGGSAGSSENLIPRIYRKWKDALPDLENAPLFKVAGRKKEDDGTGRTYRFSEAEKDVWANLFDYKGSEEHVRLRFSIEKLGATLDDTVILYEDAQDSDAWEKFITTLKSPSDTSAVTGQTDLLRGAGKRASIERMAFPLPEKPSVAVLPFTNMSDDPKQDYLADGLAEEIINALSRLSSVFVIARNSTFTYKGKNVNIHQVAEEMGVQYVLEGSVRKMGRRIRIAAQLIDALTGSTSMSEHYEQDMKDVFAIQDDVTMKVLTSLRVKLTEGESARTFARGTKNLEAYLKVLQAYELRLVYNKENLARAHRLAEEAIALDPQYALAYSYLALSLHNEVNFGVYDNPKEVLKRAYKLAEKAVALDDSSAWSHMALGLLNTTYKHDLDKSIAEAQRAVAVEPGAAYGYGYLASTLVYAARYEDAIPYYKKAFRLSPHPMPIWPMNLAWGHTAMGQYEEATKILKKIVQKEPDQTRAHTGLAEAYVLSGRGNEARKEAVEILRIDPTFAVESFYRDQPYSDRAEVGRRKDALREAGLK